jgi:hypothetical protein
VETGSLSLRYRRNRIAWLVDSKEARRCAVIARALVLLILVAAVYAITMFVIAHLLTAVPR